MSKKRLSVSEIYITYKKVMHFEANKYLKDVGLEEDAVQEMLIKVMRNIEKISDMCEEERYRYIRKIAKFTAIDVFNKEMGKWQNGESYDDINSIEIQDEIKIEEEISRLNIGPYIDEYIEKLSEIDREIISLVYGYDLEYREISKLLRIEEAAVRKRLSRAKKRLKEEIERGK